MSAASDFDTAMAAAATALGTSDYTTARQQLLVAEAHALRLPQSTTTGSVTTQERALADVRALRETIQQAGGSFMLLEEHLVPGE